MRLLLTGGSGLVGTEVRRLAPGLGHELFAPPSDVLDVTEPASVRDAVRLHRPEAILHCAAYTAVDGAEAEPDLARRVNRDGTAAVARAAAEAEVACVYVSTDFVFPGDGDRPWAPADPPSPLGVYGRTKLEGEEAVKDIAPVHMIVRTSWVYGGGGANFVRSIIERARSGGSLRVVADQVGRPTWARNLAEVLLLLTERRARGVWHVADGGRASWHELAVEALRLQGIPADVQPVSTEEWAAAAPRPRFSVLDTRGTEDFLRRPMMHWKEALRRFLSEPPHPGRASP